ncbi:MAG: transcriptional regulator [Erysipelotrichaceae bacterium]|nr:transcriptional regulator [Erysipelotrichaceae bacterium]
MEEKKKNLLAVLHILREYSDEEHILTQKMISNKLNELYDLDLDRRTIYKNMEILEEFGYDISDYSDNGVGYYLGDREFDKNEVFLLCNAIHSSNFIPPHNSKELIQKLLSTQSKYKREEYERVNFVDNNNKKDNKEFFLNIELLSEAITNRQVISFDYMRYNKDKELIKRREEPYYVCPYYLVYMNEKTYLIAQSLNHPGFAHYRVDRMQKIEVAPDKKFIELENPEDPYQYAKNKIYMYAGENISVTLRCDYGILDDIIDIFGKDIVIQEDDLDHFTTRVSVSRQGMIYLALQYIEYLEILEPSSLREDMKKYLFKGNMKYI